MIGAMARHRVQVLRTAGKTLKQIVADTGVSQSSVQRIERERAIELPGDLLRASERGVGRPSVVEQWRAWVAGVLAAEPALPTVEILHRFRRERGADPLLRVAAEVLALGRRARGGRRRR